MTRTPLKDFEGRIIGFLEDTNNIIIAKDFYGRIVGKYHKDTNKTHDFEGRIIGKGDLTSALIYKANQENQIKRKNEKK